MLFQTRMDLRIFFGYNIDIKTTFHHHFFRHGQPFMTVTNTFHVQVYYEDTDHSGVVYHANYLKYFERAREHLLGIQDLVDLFERDGVGFVVYKADLTYKKGAQFGDHVRIETTVEQESAFRLIFRQIAKLDSDSSVLVDGLIDLVCVDRDRNLIKLPEVVLRKLHLQS